MKRLLFFLCCALASLSCRQEHNSLPGAPISVTDDVGHVVVMQHLPRRIVSLAPSITETIFALGLDSSVVGVTDYCDYPAAARVKPKIGGMLNPNIERVLAMSPDLVLMTGSGNMRSDFDKLTTAGATVFVSYPRSVDGVLKSIEDLGRLTGTTRAADSLLTLLRRQRDELVRRAAADKTPTALMLLSINPIIAAGSGTFLDELIGLANGRNIAHNSATAYPLLSREEILRRQPDVIIATNDIAKSAGDLLNSYPEWQYLNAIRTHRVVIVDASIVSRPGPRIIDGLAAIVNALHPQR